jgi:hypothetical protein
MQRLHNRFHVSVLTKYIISDQFPSRPIIFTRPPAIMNDKEETWEIEKLLKHKGNDKTLQFLVHWKNYPLEEATWESVQHLKLCLDSIHEYERDVLHGQKLSLPRFVNKVPLIQPRNTRSRRV